MAEKRQQSLLKKQNLPKIKPRKLSLIQKEKDYQCAKCDASWNEEKSIGIKSVWVDCDVCKKSVHIKCVSTEQLNKFGLDDPSFGNDSECDFICEECDKDE